MWIKLAAALLGLAVFMQACGFKVEPEEDCNFVQNSLSQRVSWNGRTPILLYVHSSVPEEYYDAIDSATERWRLANGGSQLFKLGGWTNDDRGARQDGASVIYMLNTWDGSRPDEQGRTTVYWTGTQIFEADILINNKNFEFSWEDEGVPGKVDFESLMVHELGHVLGLGHLDKVQGSVMASTLARGRLRRDPSEADSRSLRCEY